MLLQNEQGHQTLRLLIFAEGVQSAAAWVSVLRADLIVLRPFRLKWQMPDISLGLSPALTFMYEEASQILATYANYIQSAKCHQWQWNQELHLKYGISYFHPWFTEESCHRLFRVAGTSHMCCCMCFSIAEERECLLSPAGRCWRTGVQFAYDVISPIFISP